MGMRRPAVILAVAALSLVRAGDSPPGAPPREPAGPRQLTVLHTADGLGAVVAHRGDLWLDDRARERLLHVDGRTGRVLAAIPVDGRTALAAGAGAVWALQSGGGYGIGLRGPLLRIDPTTDRVNARIPLVTGSGRSVLGFGVQVAGRDVWVWGPDDILKIDRRAGGVASRISVGGEHGELTGLVAARTRLVAGTADGHLIRFDARTGRRTGVLRLPLRKPSPRALGHGLLLYTASGRVGAIDPATGRTRWRRRLGFRAGAIVARDGVVWVHSAATYEPGDRVTALRLATGAVLTTRIVPAFGSTGIAVVAGHVAVATAGGDLVVLIPDEAAAVRRPRTAR
jgi:outer membrane protein assembly factor BamB